MILSGFVRAQEHLRTGADQTELYLSYLKNKNIGMVINQTSVIGKNEVSSVDSLLKLGIHIKKIFGPEHGFRGTASTLTTAAPLTSTSLLCRDGSADREEQHNTNTPSQSHKRLLISSHPLHRRLHSALRRRHCGGDDRRRRGTPSTRSTRPPFQSSGIR